MGGLGGTGWKEVGEGGAEGKPAAHRIVLGVLRVDDELGQLEVYVAKVVQPEPC